MQESRQKMDTFRRNRFERRISFYRVCSFREERREIKLGKLFPLGRAGGYYRTGREWEIRSIFTGSHHFTHDPTGIFRENPSFASSLKGRRRREVKISSLFHHFCPICSINIVRIAGIVFWNFNREGGGNKTYRFDRSITKNSWENRNWTYNFPP